MSVGRANARRLFKIAALFVIIVLEIVLPLFWIPCQWVALTSGFLGSIALIIPPMRIELAKGARTRIHKLGKVRSPAFVAERKETEEALKVQIEEEHPWDAFCLILGGVFLASHFILQVPYERELVHRNELTQGVINFKANTPTH